MATSGTAQLTPVRLEWRGDQPVLLCCDFGDAAFTEPLFSQSCLKLQPRELVEMGMEELRDSGEPGLQPSGFIFHLSRCGSTLVSRLLSTSERILVLAEPAPVGRLFRFPPSVDEDRVVEWLRDLILILGRPRRASERHYVIKLPSLLTIALPLIRRAFPETPWCFIFRDPGEVMVSVLDRPTGFLRKKARPEEAARWLPVPPEAIAAMSREEYVARLLARMSECALEEAERTAPGLFRLIDYRRLPEAVWTGVAPLLGIALTPAEEARMREASSFYSKDPGGTLRFQGDSAQKARRIHPAIRDEVERWAAGPHRRLLDLA